MTDKRIVLVTVPDRTVGRTLARALVEKKLAACVNVVEGMTSIYAWKGAVEQASEVLLICKTRADLFPVLQQELLTMHPYSVPEIIALPIEAGHTPYLQWIDESVLPPQS